MWAILRSLMMKGLIVRTVLRSFGWLGWLLPIGWLLSWIGWPLLSVLGVLALPVLVLLFILGLPIFLVFLVGGLLMSLLGFLLTLGIAALKIAIPVVIIVWLWRRWSDAEVAPASTGPTPTPDSPGR